MQMKLTKRSVDAAWYEREKGADYRWDTETTGFGLRVYPSGKKSFVVTYRVRGKQRFFTIGRLGEMTPHEARQTAKKFLAQARLGEDPSGKRLEDLQAPTMTDLARRYMTEHANLHKKPNTAKVDQQTWDRLILPKLGNRKVKDITRVDIQALHGSLAEKPGMANLMRTILSKGFNLAEVWGWRQQGSNPCRHVQRFKLEKRERFLSELELARLSDVLAEAEQSQTETPFVIAAFRLLILTGCRVGEILTLQWEHVDFERSCLNLPDSKTGPKIVYLNGPALQVLAGLERVEGNEYVIVGRRGRRVTSLRSMWLRMCERAGLKNVRVHDLRHSYASFGVGLGLPLQQVGKLLGHSKTSTTERYAHLTNERIRRANDRIGDHVWAVMSGQPKAEVITIRKGHG